MNVDGKSLNMALVDTLIIDILQILAKMYFQMVAMATNHNKNVN